MDPRKWLEDDSIVEKLQIPPAPDRSGPVPFKRAELSEAQREISAVQPLEKLLEGPTDRGEETNGGRAKPFPTLLVLAFLTPAKLAECGPSQRRFTRQTLDGVALTKDLQQIRKRGYSVNRGEWDEQVGAVAAPVFDARGDVVASAGVILPANRLINGKTVQIGAWTMIAAASMSERLGYRSLRSTLTAAI